jgi:hypothetical protein
MKKAILFIMLFSIVFIASAGLLIYGIISLTTMDARIREMATRMLFAGKEGYQHFYIFMTIKWSIIGVTEIRIGKAGIFLSNLAIYKIVKKKLFAN